MADYDETDLTKGIIRYGRQKVPEARLTAKAETAQIVPEDTITLTSKLYTDHSGTSSETIFSARIDDVTIKDFQDIKATSKLDEIFTARWTGTWQGYVEVVAGELIKRGIAEGKLNNVLINSTSSNATLRPDAGEGAPGVNWDVYGASSGWEAVDEVTPNEDTDYVYSNTLAALAYFKVTPSMSSSYNYNIYKIELFVRGKHLDQSAYKDVRIGLTIGGDLVINSLKTLTTSYADYSAVSADNLNYSQTQLDDCTISLTQQAYNNTIRVTQVYIVAYYTYYPDFTKSSSTISYYADGEKSIASILDELTLLDLWTWYINADNYIQFNDGTKDTGVTISSSSSVSNVSGMRQIKKYNTVILYGGYSGGDQLVSQTGSGDPIYEGTFMNVYTQEALDDLCTKVYALLHTNNPPYKIKMDYVNSAKGLLQVGELLTIGSGLYFSNSTISVPTGSYTIDECDYHLDENGYQYLSLTLIDELFIEKIKILKGKRQIAVVANQANDNSTGISQVSAAGGGEANTGQNIGTDGVGVYSGKSGVTLQFHHIAPGSSKITVTANGEDIDIDIDEDYFTHLHDGDTLECDGIDSGTGDFIFDTYGELYLRPSNSGVEYLRFSVANNEVVIKRVNYAGSGITYFDSTDAYDCGVGAYRYSASAALSLILTNFAATPYGRVLCSHNLQIEPNGGSGGVGLKLYTTGSYETTLNFLTTGHITGLTSSPSTDDEAASKGYVDDQVGGAHSLADTLAVGYETNGASIYVDSGGELRFYSDDKVTLKAGIAAASGNIVTYAGELLAYYDGSTGVAVGAAKDMKLYHNGTNSFIDNNTGSLYIDTTGSLYLRTNGSTQAIVISTGQVATFAQFPITPSAAPTSDYQVANKKYVDDSGGADPDAIHDNVSGEIAAITEKTIPVGQDLLLIEDSAASNAKKKITIDSIVYEDLNQSYRTSTSVGTLTTGSDGGKEIVLHEDANEVIVTWESKSSQAGAGAYTRLYKNDVAVDVGRAVSVTSYQTHSAVLTGIVAGDVIEIWGSNWTSGQTVYVRNFRIRKAASSMYVPFANCHTNQTEYSGVISRLTNSQSFGKAVYHTTTAYTVGLADCSTPTRPAIGISVGTNLVVTHGYVHCSNFSFSNIGYPVFLSTSGNVTQTAPSTSGHMIQVIGIAVDSEGLLVCPSLDWLIRA